MKSAIIAALLCSTVLVAPARAMPQIVPTLSFLLGGAGSATVTSIFGISVTSFAGELLVAGLRLGGSILLSAAASALGPKPPATPELIRALQEPQSLIPKRAVYGEARIYGSPIWRVKGDILYGCLVLNSRASTSVSGIWFDKRECALTGNRYDFAGGGATATADPFSGHVKVWIGLGSQTSPPAEIVAEAPEIFPATAGGRGLTLAWLRIDCGDNTTRAERWPRTPPEVEFFGQWSKVYDPRDVDQDQDDKDTWQWSANQALCTLDAARTNPIRQYPMRQIHLESFVDAANLADENVPLRAGGGEPRYRVNGALVFNGAEIMDQLLPLFEAGAAQPCRIGGRLAIAPGKFTAPVATLTDILEADGLQVQSHKPGRDLATTVRCTFTDPTRDWRTSELSDYTVPGAQAADGGLQTTVDISLPLVTSASQAMRLQKIKAHVLRAQRQLVATLPPAWFKVVAGSNITVAFPAPYAALNGILKVISANPGIFLNDGADGVAMRVPIVAEETSESIFAWNAATEEQIRPVVSLDTTRSPLAPPSDLTAISDATTAIRRGGESVPRIGLTFPPSTSSGVTRYDVQHRIAGGDWVDAQPFGASTTDGAGDIIGYIGEVSEDYAYDVRVRAASSSQVSAWVQELGISVSTGVTRYRGDFTDQIYEVSGVAVPLPTVLSLSRAGAATYIDAAGAMQPAAANVARFDYQTGTRALLVEPAATNDILWSQDFDNAWWSKSRATITANAATAPDGTTTADSLVDDLTTGGHSVFRTGHSFTAGQVCALSGFAKIGTLSKFFAQFGDGTSTPFPAASTRWRAVFDLAAGTISSVGADITAFLHPIGSGWFRYGIIGTAQATGTDRVFVMQMMTGVSTGYTATGTGNMLIWGAQLEASRVTSYIATAGAAASRAADAAAMQGITATLDLAVTYGDGTPAALSNQGVYPGFWPVLAQTRLRRILGTP